MVGYASSASKYDVGDLERGSDDGIHGQEVTAGLGEFCDLALKHDVGNPRWSSGEGGCCCGK